MSVYKFDCGCRIPIINEDIKDNDGLPSMKIPYNELTYQLNYSRGCDDTWDMIGSGKTKGVFQLESNLGKAWAKRLAPTSLEEIAALVSLIRPGCLRAIVDGKSLTQHYVDRKHGRDEVKYFHQALEPALTSTYGVMSYQEQAMRIARDIAGFNEQEADVLRKAIGKKDAELMAKIKDWFIEGCKAHGVVNDEEAAEIFSWIQESQRYSFNKSHGVGYGLVGYLTAFTKHHFPLHFYCSWLKYARDKLDSKEETKELVADAKSLDIYVNVPSIDTIFNNDADVCIHNNEVYFGMRCVKKIGEAVTNKFLDRIHAQEDLLRKPISQWTWLEFLANAACLVTSTTVNGLISVGAFSKFNLTRQRMLFEYETFKRLTAKERENIKKIADQHESLLSLLEHFVKLSKAEGGVSVASRTEKIRDFIEALKNPPHSLEDKPNWILTQERNLLGTPISFTKIDTISSSMTANTSCREFNDGKGGDCTIAGELIEVREYIIPKGTNKGNKMGFATIEDGTGQTNCVIFSNIWDEFEDELVEGNTVVIAGSRSNQESFQITKVLPI